MRRVMAFAVLAGLMIGCMTQDNGGNGKNSLPEKRDRLFRGIKSGHNRVDTVYLYMSGLGTFWSAGRDSTDKCTYDYETGEYEFAAGQVMFRKFKSYDRDACNHYFVRDTTDLEKDTATIHVVWNTDGTMDYYDVHVTEIALTEYTGILAGLKLDPTGKQSIEFDTYGKPIIPSNGKDTSLTVVEDTSLTPVGDPVRDTVSHGGNAAVDTGRSGNYNPIGVGTGTAGPGTVGPGTVGGGSVGPGAVDTVKPPEIYTGVVNLTWMHPKEGDSVTLSSGRIAIACGPIPIHPAQNLSIHITIDTGEGGISGVTVISPHWIGANTVADSILDSVSLPYGWELNGKLRITATPFYGAGIAGPALVSKIKVGLEPASDARLLEGRVEDVVYEPALISTEGNATPGFFPSPGMLSSINVMAESASVSLKARQANATLISGAATGKGSLEFRIPLSKGENLVDFTIFSADGKSHRSYRYSLMKIPKQPALKSLIAEGGVISPAFDPALYLSGYGATPPIVVYAATPTQIVRLIAVAEDAASEIQIDPAGIGSPQGMAASALMRPGYIRVTLAGISRSYPFRVQIGTPPIGVK